LRSCKHRAFAASVGDIDPFVKLGCHIRQRQSSVKGCRLNPENQRFAQYIATPRNQRKVEPTQI
jgi:hypothetical protein